MTSSTMSDLIPRAAVRGLVADVFEEIALVLGGLIAVHRVDDELVWRFVRGLDGVRLKAIRGIETRDQEAMSDSTPTEPDLRPHPAIEEFLLKLRRD